MKPNHALNDLLRVAKMARSSFYYKEIKRNYHEAKEAILSLYKKNRKRDGYRPMTLKLRQMVKIPTEAILVIPPVEAS